MALYYRPYSNLIVVFQCEYRETKHRAFMNSIRLSLVFIDS